MPSSVLATNILNGFTRVATEFKTHRTLLTGTATGDLSGLTTIDKSSIIAAINEAKASGGARDLDGLTDVVITSAAEGNILYRNSTQWVNTSGTALFQPRDSDLDSIAALTTASFGRNLLTLANAAALTGLITTATTGLPGTVLLATTAENQTGTDTAKASTPAGVKAAIDQRIVNDSTLGGASPSTVNAPSIASVKAYADGRIAAQDAFVAKGGIDASTNPNYPAADAGWSYRVTAAGKIGGASGPTVEVGDLIQCWVDGTAAGTHATVGANWSIIQTNIDGAVVGPATATSGNFAVFSGASGKVITDSGYSIDTDGAMAANSANRVPSQSAVRTYAQPLNAGLTALAGLTSAADRLPYFTGSAQAALTVLTAFGRTLIDDADAATARGTLGLGTAATQASSAFQPADATLSSLAALTTAADQTIYSTGADSFAMATQTSFARSLLDDADAATARDTLSVYSRADMGDPTTDFAAAFVAALA